MVGLIRSLLDNPLRRPSRHHDITTSLPPRRVLCTSTSCYAQNLRFHILSQAAFTVHGIVATTRGELLAIEVTGLEATTAKSTLSFRSSLIHAKHTPGLHFNHPPPKNPDPPSGSSHPSPSEGHTKTMLTQADPVTKNTRTTRA